MAMTKNTLTAARKKRAAAKKKQKPHAYQLDFLIVRVKATVAKRHLHTLDREGVAGEYHFPMPKEAAEETWTDGQCATAALDDFHESVAIKRLDDFNISVHTPDGRELFEEDPDEGWSGDFGGFTELEAMAIMAARLRT